MSRAKTQGVLLAMIAAMALVSSAAGNLVVIRFNGVVTGQSDRSEDIGGGDSFFFPPPFDNIPSGAAAEMCIVYDTATPPSNEFSNGRSWVGAIKSVSGTVNGIAFGPLIPGTSADSNFTIINTSFGDRLDLLWLQNSPTRVMGMSSSLVDLDGSLFPGSDAAGIPTTLPSSLNPAVFNPPSFSLVYSSNSDSDWAQIAMTGTPATWSTEALIDCNNNFVPDDHDIDAGTSDDCDNNGVPDECEGTICDSTAPSFSCLPDITITTSDSTDPMNTGTLEPLLYWAFENGQSLGRSTLDGSSHELLRTGTAFRDVAFDSVNGKIYWTENGGQVIRKMDIDGDNADTALDVGFARGITIDDAAGKMYWVENDAVRRADLDGSNVEDLAVTADAQAIDLDLTTGRVYWGTTTLSATAGLWFVNLDGTSPGSVFTGGSGVNGATVVPEIQTFFATRIGDVIQGNVDGTGIGGLGVSPTNGTGNAYDPVTDTVYYGSSLGPNSDIRRVNADGSGDALFYRISGGPPSRIGLEVIRPVTDDVDPDPMITFSDNVIPGPCAGSSIIERTWTATDFNGNSAQCTQLITVLPDDDNDEVCNEFDICPGGDDNVDNDSDGVPDACDACPDDMSVSQLGACVFADNSCALLCPDACANQSGSYLGEAVLCPPPNDSCATATVISEGETLPWSLTGSTNVPDGYGCGMENGVYFLYTATCQGIVTFTIDSASNSEFSILTADFVGCGNTAGYSCSSFLTPPITRQVFAVEPGEMILLKIATHDGSAPSGTVQVACDPAGACCLPEIDCQYMKATDCAAAGGIYKGNGTGCSDFADCNNNDVPDDCDITFGTSDDCNNNGMPDECELVGNDCNSNGVPDECELAGNDCNSNNIPDDCELAGNDCNNNSVPDECELAGNDCNSNNVPDDCDVAILDCNSNQIPDDCELAGNDCNNNGTPDDCELAGNDCNSNNVPDDCDVAILDCNGNQIPDDCELAGNDCNNNNTPDDCELVDNDCNSNFIPDDCELLGNDWNDNGIPDDCELEGNDCNNNLIPDDCEIDEGTAQDCNGDGVPDECQLGPNDCNLNLIPDECDIDSGFSQDCNNNGTPDECELDGNDCNANFIPDECELAGNDCNNNGMPDDCDLTDNDCNANGTPDECELAGNDCNTNEVPDDCELIDNDCNNTGIPDECELAGNDCNANGVPDECDDDCNTDGTADDCETADEYAPLAFTQDDLCADAKFMDPGFAVQIDTTADTTVNVQFCNSQFSAYNVWAKYRASSTGLAYVTATQSPMPTMVVVFDDCPADGGAPIACNWPNPGGATFNAERGETYWIMFGGYGFAQGNAEASIVGPRGLRNPSDYNRNGVPDECDCLFDVNGDGTVDMVDFVAAVQQYGQCLAMVCSADVDGDGDVDDADLSLILMNQGDCLLNTQATLGDAAPVRRPLKGGGGRIVDPQQ